MQSAAGGDARAFGRLVTETQGVVCAISLAVTRDQAASEDVAQQVFFDAWRGIGKLRAATSFLPWLRALARYCREGQSVRQVAELLGMREATVKQRLSRARRALRAEYLARVGKLLDHSAPGAAFTAMVTAGLATAALAASPGVAAAAVLSKGVAAGGSGSLTGAALLGASATGLVGGVGGGLLGPFVGARALWRKADSAEERAAVRRYALSALSATIVCTVVLVSEAMRTDGARPIAVTLAAIAMQASFMWHHLSALPRARALRLARERARDPIGTAARERRRTWAMWAGFLLGTLGGGAPLVWLWASR